MEIEYKKFMEGKLLEEAPSEKDPKKGKFNWVFYNHNLKESSYCQGMKIMIEIGRAHV